MNQRTINLACILLAVAGVSFGIGQTVGQERAEAGAQSSRIQSVKDPAALRELKGIRNEIKLTRAEVDAVEAQLRLNTSTSFGITSKTIKGLVLQTCRNTDPAKYSGAC